MSPEAQVILAAIGILVGGGFATLLGVLTNSLLKAQQQQGAQQAEWKAIAHEKDKQIERLEGINERQAKRIGELEQRVEVAEKRALRAEARVEHLEQEIRNG